MSAPDLLHAACGTVVERFARGYFCNHCGKVVRREEVRAQEVFSLSAPSPQCDLFEAVSR